MSAHFVFECLAYLAAFQLFRARRRRLGDVIPQSSRFSVLAAAALGAALGSRLLAGLNQALMQPSLAASPALWISGKTVVGGFLGGWAAVEWVKASQGIRVATGDLFAAPMALGLVIGRIGCALAGLDDHTAGIATSLPWGLDFGDGIRRHPTQIYESLFAALLLAWLLLKQPPKTTGGDFKAFMAAYLGFRLLVDFIKPDSGPLGMSAIQWACLAGLLHLARYYSKERLNG